MKNAILPVVILIAVGAVLWFRAGTPSSTPPPEDTTARQSSTVSGDAAGDADTAQGGELPNSNPAGVVDLEGDLVDFENGLPPHATDVYKNAEDALAAVRKGAESYDDLVLEQFTEMPADCSWCNAFYQEVLRDLQNPSGDAEQRAFLAEILAVSGRLDNVQALVDGITRAKSEDESDIYAQALELAVGKDDVIQYLGSQVDTSNELLQESVVAALTNQRSRAAAEILFAHIRAKNDPTGYENLGLGPAEFIPDDEALPVFQDALQKRDQFSPLAAKALANAGLSGLRIVMESVSTSGTEAANRELIRGIEDHVSYDEETEQYSKDLSSSSKNPVITEFAQRMLQEFQEEAEDLAEDEGV